MKAGCPVLIGKIRTARSEGVGRREEGEITASVSFPLFLAPFPSPPLLLPSSFSRSFSCMDRCSAGTSMLSGDKVLFFTKPPSVAQARPIRRQWLVNSSQSGGKPRRDRGNGVILLMNYLSGQNNNVLSPFHSSSQTSLFLLFLFASSPLFYPVPIRYLSSRRNEIEEMARTSSRSLLILIEQNDLIFIIICENQRVDSLVNSSYRLKCSQ